MYPHQPGCQQWSYILPCFFYSNFQHYGQNYLSMPFHNIGFVEILMITATYVKLAFVFAWQYEYYPVIYFSVVYIKDLACVSLCIQNLNEPKTTLLKMLIWQPHKYTNTTLHTARPPLVKGYLPTTFHNHFSPKSVLFCAHLFNALPFSVDRKTV